jgi:hypothetical protein
MPKSLTAYFDTPTTRSELLWRIIVEGYDLVRHESARVSAAS